MRSIIKRSCSRLIKTHVRLKEKRRLETTVAPGILLQPQEDFFILVANGDVEKLKRFIAMQSVGSKLCFDVNIVNYQNDNAMSIAVNAGDKEMVGYLFTLMKISKKRVLLNAINRGDVELVQFLCEVMCADVKDESMEDGIGESEFPPHMEPLMLAAIVGHLDMVSYLIGRGHALAEPHKPGCQCEFCMKSIEQMSALAVAQLVYDKYRALASPEFIVHTTADPIYYCFALHELLKQMAYIEQPFNVQYEEICTNLRRFAAALVDRCNSAEEVEIVLNQRRPVFNKYSFLQDMSETIYPRLALAFQCKQKEFITSNAVQFFMEHQFHGSFRDYPLYGGFSKAFLPLVRISTIPSLLFTVIFCQTSELACFYSAPVNRMLHFIATYLIFLFVISMECARDKEPERHPIMTSNWTWLMAFYIVGFTALVIHRILYIHPLRFIKSFWNVYDVVMLALYISYMSFSIANYIHNWNPRLYLNAASRTNWHSLDPQLLAEGVLVTANIMAFLRLFRILQAYAPTGKLVLAICRSLKCCIKFCVYVVALLLVYTTAYSKFYSYYSGMRSRDTLTGEISTQEESFVDWTRSFKTFFWTMLTQTDQSLADVVLARDFLNVAAIKNEWMKKKKKSKRATGGSVVAGLPEAVRFNVNSSELGSILHVIANGSVSAKLNGTLPTQGLKNQLHFQNRNVSYLVLGASNDTRQNWTHPFIKGQKVVYAVLGTFPNSPKNVSSTQNSKPQFQIPKNVSSYLVLGAINNKTRTSPTIEGQEAKYVVLGTVKDSIIQPLHLLGNAVVGDVNRVSQEPGDSGPNETSLAQKSSSMTNNDEIQQMNSTVNDEYDELANETDVVPTDGVTEGSPRPTAGNFSHTTILTSKANYTDNHQDISDATTTGPVDNVKVSSSEIGSTTAAKLSSSEPQKKTKNRPANDDVKDVPKSKIYLTEDHMFTQAVGYVGFGSFCALIFVIALNVLSTVICKTYTDFQSEIDKHWLYVRTEIFYLFMLSPIFPPPFNLIPHGYTKMERGYEFDLEAKLKCRRKFPDCDYWALMKVLVSRYYQHKWKKSCCGKTLDKVVTFFPAGGVRQLNLPCEDAIAPTEAPA